MRNLDRLLASACCVSLVGCTTLTPVGMGGLAPSAASGDEHLPLVKEGDIVVIGLKDGRSLEGRLERLGSDFIEVRSEGGQATERLLRDQLASVDQRRFSVMKTVFLVAGITLGMYAYAYSKALEGLLGLW